MRTYSLILALLISSNILISQSSFPYPSGKSLALSFTWDDGRESQMTQGLPLLDKYGVKATFYVLPGAVEKQLPLWKTAVQHGHEIANHSSTHPCSGNFQWSRKNALEEYTLSSMEENLLMANTKIENLLGIKMTEFAYPCGQSYVGSGENTNSYVPLIAKHFQSGRTWLDESPNDPAYCDLSQITGIEMDGKSYKQILKWIETARTNHLWLVLAGHDIGDKANQTTETRMLKKIFNYLQNDGKDVWVAPVGEVVKWIKEKRG